jgi:peptidoglycan-N-acetylglucosamine deacetylase
MNFFKTPAFLKYCYPDLLWDATDNQADTFHLYVTFDDGPVPEITDFVLETLESYQARATFFCVGENIQKHPQVYQSVLLHHHATGNHTYNHLNGWKTDNAAYFENVRLCEAAMEQGMERNGGQKKLFRPPYGKIKRSQIRHISQGYSIVMWHILSGDFDANFDAETCLKKCIAHTRSGTIIIFHDSYKAEKNLKYVLPRYLDHFAQAGYRFLSL